MKVKFSAFTHFLFALFVFISPVFAQEHTGDAETEIHDKMEHDVTTSEKEFDLAGFILHHISDDYGFHVIGDHHSSFHLTIPLPVIIYTPGSGLDVFSSSELTHPDPTTGLVRGKYFYSHGVLSMPSLVDGKVQLDENGHAIGKHEARLTDLGSDNVFYNFSITKNVFGLLLAVIILLVIFLSVAKAYKTRGITTAPKGFQNAMESLVLFVQNEIAIPFIGEKKYAKFLPYLLTVFFFIWINNIIGLIPFFPGSANVSGNIAFTFFLAFCSLILVFINGNKHFWGHILWMPGVPVILRPMLAIIELIGVFTKPFSLMIRLFANITAGHIIIMSIIGITFIINSIVVGIGTSIFSVVMFILETLVAAIQAYIFTLLTAQMIGAAVEDGHHEHAHDKEHAH